MAPKLCSIHSPKKNRGRRECRVHDAPAASHATKKAHERSHHRYAETTGHSLRVGFNGYFVLSPVTGSFATVASRKNSAKLDTSVGVPGPHDFAVHNKPRSSSEAIAS